ncbi:MAG: hypothetical protein ACREJQ_04705 [bacterium]
MVRLLVPLILLIKELDFFNLKPPSDPHSTLDATMVVLDLDVLIGGAVVGPPGKTHYVGGESGLIRVFTTRPLDPKNPDSVKFYKVVDFIKQKVLPELQKQKPDRTH